MKTERQPPLRERKRLEVTDENKGVNKVSVFSGRNGTTVTEVKADTIMYMPKLTRQTTMTDLDARAIEATQRECMNRAETAVLYL